MIYCYIINSPAGTVDVDEKELRARTVQMRNFPASWVADGSKVPINKKISKLLEKFGKLEGSIAIAHVGGARPGIVATALFAESAAASKAAQTLHGVDSRTEKDRRPALKNHS